jgi:hypothetical protein
MKTKMLNTRKTLAFFKVLCIVVLFVAVSCEEDQLRVTSEPSASEASKGAGDSDHDLITKDVTIEYYLNDRRVRPGSFDPENPELYVLASGVPDSTGDAVEKVVIHAYSTKEGYIKFGKVHNLKLEEQLFFEEHMSEYAKTSGAIAYFDRTGTIPDFYSTYCKEFYNTVFKPSINGKVAGTPIALHKDYVVGPTWISITGTLAIMPPGWNNQVSRYMSFGIYGATTMYDDTFFRKRLFTRWGWGWNFILLHASYGLGFANDKMSSGLNF